MNKQTGKGFGSQPHQDEASSVATLGSSSGSSNDRGTCRCGKPGEWLHTCPYAVDIYEDSESLCNCCGGCEYDCAMDI